MHRGITITSLKDTLSVRFIFTRYRTGREHQEQGGPMTFTFSCEKCGKLIEVDESMVGKKGRCKQCGHIFPIPSAQASGLMSSTTSGPASPPPLPKGTSARPARSDEDDLFAAVPPPPRRVVPEAEIDDDPPLTRPGRPKAKAGPLKASGGRGVLFPLIVVGALGGLFLMVVLLAALLIPAIKAARQAADRARAKAEARTIAQRPPMPTPQPVALTNTPAPGPSTPVPAPTPAAAPSPTPAGAEDPLVNDDYRTNEQFLKDILDKLTQMANLLASIRDQRSAQRVAPQIQSVATDLMQFEERAKGLPALTEEQDNQLQQKYEPLLQAAKERIDREGARVQAIGGAPNLGNPRIAGIGPRMGRQPLAGARARARLGVRGPNMAPRPVPVQPPAPGPMDSNTTITINVTGIPDKETGDYIGQRIGEIGKSLGTKRLHGQGNSSSMTYQISPLSDPRVFADRIDFGQVTRVEARTIDVVARPLRPGEARPADGDFLAQALYDLKSPLQQTRKQALSRLLRAPVDPSRRAEIALAIVPMLQEPDGFSRADAAKALASWGGPESVPALIEALKDTAFNVRWAVLDTLKVLKDPEAAQALATMVAEDKDRGKAIDALKAIGPPAEDSVIPLLSHGENRVRSDACKILEVIGSEKSVPMLRRLAMSQAGGSARDAGEALKSMGLRGVNLNVTSKKKRR
jgi:hypothetical protein